MALSLRQLEALVLAREHGSLSQAAQAMGITPSAASLLLRQLEQDLGLSLFERSARGLRATEAGEAALPLARQILAGLGQLERLAQDHRQLLQGRLRLAASPAMARHLLPPLMRRFAARHPGIALALDDRRTAALARAIADDEADLALATETGSWPEGVAAEPLLRDPLCLVCRRADAPDASATADWSTLHGRSLIMVQRGSGVRELLDQALQAQGLAVHAAFEVSQLGTALALVEQGLGEAVLPSFLLSFAPSTTLIARPLHPAYTRTVHMLWRLPPAPPVQAFAALLRDELGD